MNEPTHVDLFSGIGGFALAAQWAGFRTIAFCEIDKYCQKVLAKNFLADATGDRFDGRDNRGDRQDSLDGERYATPDSEKRSGGQRGTSEVGEAGIFGNIFDFDGTAYRGCDLLTGGFPCQPFSVAGKRRGAADDRAIWPEMFRVIEEARPAWVLGENVPGIIPMELDNVLSDLESIGYATRPFVIPACAVDARHRRDRLWIIGRNVAESESEGLERRMLGSVPRMERFREASRAECCNWLPEPDVGRVDHGVPSRVDRLKGLGNAVVPQVAYEILKEIRRLILNGHRGSGVGVVDEN